jgi:hypothetical protein
VSAHASRMLDLPGRADALLRGRSDGTEARPTVADSLTLIVAAGLVYGAAMGTWGGGTPLGRPLQVSYSAVKVPALLLVTFGLSLPSFFVINTVVGLRADFGRALAALLDGQAAAALVLASLAPVTLTWYASSDYYQANVAFNGVMFLVAALAGQFVLRRAYRPLIERDVRHKQMLRYWLVVYLFVAIQLAYVLRPFIGSPGQPTQFFREGAWENAYEQLARLVWQIVRGIR